MNLKEWVNPTGESVNVSISETAIIGRNGEIGRPLCAMFFLILIICGLERVAGAAEGNKVGNLDDYLKQLRYEGIPLRGENQRCLVDATIAGKKVVLLVDTGAPITCVDEKVGKKLKTLDQLGVTLEDSLLGKLSGPEIVLIEKFGMGKAQFMNQPARVESVKLDYLHTVQEGLLGCDFLIRNHCLIDLMRRQLYVRGTKLSEQEATALNETLRLSGLVAANIAFERGRMNVPVRIEQKETKMFLDTGAVWSVIDTSVAKQIGLQPVARDSTETGTAINGGYKAAVVGMKEVGHQDVWGTLVERLGIGPKEFRKQVFFVSNLKTWANGALSGHDGLIAADILERRGAIIDCEGMKVWFRPEVK